MSKFRHTYTHTHTHQSHMKIINVCFYSSKTAPRNTLTLLFITAEIKHRCFQIKKKYITYIHKQTHTHTHTHTHTDGNRILAVVAKSTWYRPFSCTQTGKRLDVRLVTKAIMSGRKTSSLNSLWNRKPLVYWHGRRILEWKKYFMERARCSNITNEGTDGARANSSTHS
jgi:hypothetical protein